MTAGFKSESPAGFVGIRSHWVAIEIHGRAGGLFRSRKDAVDYAEDETDHRPDAVLLSGERISLRI